MKVKLQERGWFDKARKKSLPKYPKTIGVVTSATGSVIQDILHILTRRLSGFHLILNPVKVQGENAAQEIAEAIDQFNKYQLADVLIVGRGGGSLEDLWAFNEEEVARALFDSKIPVVSAVGHETDYCIADFVADARAPTPSAAAEIITTEKARELHFLAQLKSRMHTTVLMQLAHAKKQCEHFKRRTPSPAALLTPHMQRIDDLHSDLTEAAKRFVKEKRARLLLLAKEIALQNPQHQLTLAKAKILSFDRSLRTLFKSIAEKREKLQQLVKHLKGIDPKNLLAKGFCIAFDEREDVLIYSAHALRAKDTVRLLMHDGNVRLIVNKCNT
jgi:exodeoxyribonuclease VII large subunit